ncbi:MAG: Rrf2 family transcriptional regulator, partial [Rhizobiales bacterium]|nr:Rrf2 family transcriptional regulator [Hyphomicrobiales bacterium]
VYDALDASAILALGFDAGRPNCLVEQAVNLALGEVFNDAEQLILTRFKAITLAQISEFIGKDVAEVGNFLERYRPH